MKVFLFLLTAILISSCRASCSVRDAGQRTPDSISRVEYDGHKYLLFERYGGVAATTYSMCVLHDPDCACNPEKK